MPRGGSVAGRVAVATTPVGCRGGLLPLGRASLTAAVPSPRGILTQKFGSLYWIEKGSVCPRREPATDPYTVDGLVAARLSIPPYP